MKSNKQLTVYYVTITSSYGNEVASTTNATKCILKASALRNLMVFLALVIGLDATAIDRLRQLMIAIQHYGL